MITIYIKNLVYAVCHNFFVTYKVGMCLHHYRLGPRRIFTSRALSARRGGHAVRVWRRGRSAGLNVDGRQNVTGNAPTPASDAKMTVMPYLFIGKCNVRVSLFSFQAKTIVYRHRIDLGSRTKDRNSKPGFLLGLDNCRVILQ